MLPDGRPAAMPSEDYFGMSDQELSDIIAYIRSQPPVDRESRPRELGMVGTVLMALKKIKISAEHAKHDAAHPKHPPRAANTAEFGRHLIGVCTGCHSATLAGGPIVGGDPKWPPAANITDARRRPRRLVLRGLRRRDARGQEQGRPGAEAAYVPDGSLRQADDRHRAAGDVDLPSKPSPQSQRPSSSPAA